MNTPATAEADVKVNDMFGSAINSFSAVRMASFPFIEGIPGTIRIASSS